MSRALIVVGLIAVAAGLLWPWLSRMPLGHLPGDLIIRREGFTVYVPIATMALVSVVVSLLLWLFGR